MTFCWHPLMLQQEHPESLVSSLVLSEIEMAYLRTEKKAQVISACSVEWWKNLCGESTSACCKEGNKTGFSPVSFVCSFPFQSSVYHTYRSSYRASVGRMVLWIRYRYRPQEFGAELVTVFTNRV